jgi:hypothetical protein
VNVGQCSTLVNVQSDRVARSKSLNLSVFAQESLTVVIRTPWTPESMHLKSAVYLCKAVNFESIDLDTDDGLC